MIAPYRHLAVFDRAPREASDELADLLQLSLRVLKTGLPSAGLQRRDELRPERRRGVVDHYHLHVVPRWHGDSNFMPLVAETRVFIEDLDRTYCRLAPLFAKEAAGGRTRRTDEFRTERRPEPCSGTSSGTSPGTRSRPNIGAYEDSTFPQGDHPELAELGVLGMTVPAEFGGTRTDHLSFILALEELGRVSASVCVIVASTVRCSAKTILDRDGPARRINTWPGRPAARSWGASP